MAVSDADRQDTMSERCQDVVAPISDHRLVGSSGQGGYEVRFEWGLRGLQAAGPDAQIIIVVDVLSFSTAVDIAVARGAEVFPFRWKDERAVELAESAGATLAVRRQEMSTEYPFSLSPRSLMGISPGWANNS